MVFKAHFRRIITRKESKTLNKDVCEDLVLFTLICDEVGEAGISSILCELLKDSSLFQERGVRPFTPKLHKNDTNYS